MVSLNENKVEEKYKYTFCYTVKFYDELGSFICMEPFTVTAYDSDDALTLVDDLVEKHSEDLDYYESEITLGDVC